MVEIHEIRLIYRSIHMNIKNIALATAVALMALSASNTANAAHGCYALDYDNRVHAFSCDRLWKRNTFVSAEDRRFW
jgi:hypothetical protein